MRAESIGQNNRQPYRYRHEVCFALSQLASAPPPREVAPISEDTKLKCLGHTVTQCFCKILQSNAEHSTRP